MIKSRKQTYVTIGLTVFFLLLIVGIQLYFRPINQARINVTEEAAHDAATTARSAAQSAKSAQRAADSTREAADQTARASNDAAESAKDSQATADKQPPKKK